MKDLWEALRSLGAQVTPLRKGLALPCLIRGPLLSGRVDVKASTSSQFVSALLLTLPTLEGGSEIRMRGTVVSEPYIAATLAVLRAHRVQVQKTRRIFRIPGGQTYRGGQFRVPGDASSAAYLWSAAALSGGSVHVEGVSREWPQADLKILEVLRKAGSKVSIDGSGATVRGAPDDAFVADLSDAPDLYPLLGIVAAFAPGTSRLLGAPHLIYKESDRRAATIRLATAFGAGVKSSRNGLAIHGAPTPRGANLRGLKDHRVVMSATVGALAASSPSVVGDAECVRKSFPGFWRALESLGATTELIR